MNIRIQKGLLFGSATLIFSGKKLMCSDVLIDTGSASTVFSIEKVMDIGIKPEPDDEVRELRGIGGAEFVFTKKVDGLNFGNFQLPDFTIEVGAMNYGFELDGIIGLDFLLRAKAKIDLERLEVY